MAGTGLVVQNNNTDDVAISANGDFVFSPVASGSAYNVTVKTQPSGPTQTCTVNNGSGTASSNVTNVEVNCITNSYIVSGTVNGLVGSGLVLQNNGGNDLPVGANGGFAFPTALSSGSAYGITVKTQPSSPTQVCIVSNGTGNVGAANVTNVAVTCTTSTFSVGGTVSGLSGTGLVLQNNGGTNLPIAANGGFTFPTGLSSGSAYGITVKTQPSSPTQVCTVSNGAGNVGAANVTNVAVICTTSTFSVGGTVSGLAGTGLALQNNGGNDLPIAANGGFTFSTALSSGSAYSVTVKTQPSNPARFCTVGNGTGIVTSANITNVTVTCANLFTVGGTVSGLVGTGLVLRNNGGDDLTVNASGSFTFSSPLADGAAYNVTIQSAPAGHNCTASNSAATIAGANVTNIQIQCSVSLTLGFGIKQLRFSWPTVNGALEYRLLQNPDGASGFTLLRTLAANATSTTVDVAVYRQDWSNARYLLQACNATTCSDSNEVNTAGAALQAVGYFKASNNKFLYRFGQSVAVSADGTTLAVGTIFEPSNATGINGDQSNDTAQMAGAVYVFARSGDTWSQQAYVKASNTGGFDQFGAVVSLSKDGNTLAVGAPLEDSASSDQANNAATDAGAVYVFTRSGSTWSQQAYVKASNPGDGDQFGTAVALSGDGNTLAVGAFGEASASNVINGDQTDNTASRAGAIYVYARSGSSWNQQAYLKASNAEAFDELGVSVALSENGDTLAAGALGEASGTGSASDNSLPNAGAVYVFVRSGITWTQQAYLKASNIDSGDLYAWAVALSSDGNTLAVSAPGEASAATGINGNQADNSTPSGAVYVYTRTANIWTQQAYVKASNTGSGDDFGTSITLSGDGDTLAVGAPGEASSAVGLNDGNQADNSATSAGAVYLYTRSGGAWSQSTYIKASNTDANDHFGVSVGLSADGNTLAVGATGESGSSAGVGGNQSDNSFTAAGAAYLY